MVDKKFKWHLTLKENMGGRLELGIFITRRSKQPLHSAKSKDKLLDLTYTWNRKKKVNSEVNNRITIIRRLRGSGNG